MRYRTFDDLLKHQAETLPEHPALRYGEKQWTYKELYAAVCEKAEEYRALGRTCLGVLSDGSADCVISLFGAAKAGLQLVMLDASLPDEAYPALLRYTDVDLLWGDEDLAEMLAPHLTGGVPGGSESVLFFTSGTTSRSKAVELTQESLCQSAFNGGSLLPLQEDDTLLCTLPLAHVFGFICGLLWGLYSGACVALGRGPRHYADDCLFYRPTALSAVPLLLGFLLKAKALNPELRLILIGAGECPLPILAAAKASGVRVSFGYGLTETSSGVALSLGDDPYAMTICPDDAVTIAEDGEILIKAPTCLMKGYYKMPEETAKVLKDGLLHTGDLGYIDAEGLLRITGRKKDILVLSDGTKIYLPEYEAQLTETIKAADLPENMVPAELAVTLKEGRPVLVVCDASQSAKNAPSCDFTPLSRTVWRETLLKVILPLMKTLPRGQQITDIRFTDQPLPRTATGKLKRYKL